MSDYTSVNFGQMEQGAQDFARTYSSLQSEIDQLKSQLDSNLQQWNGAAQEAYTQAKATWDAAMANMQQLIQQLGVVIGQANQAYQEAEHANTSRWG